MLHQQIKGHQITFTDSRFYVSDTGAWLPSVTTLLEAYPKSYQYLSWIKEQGENADKIRNAAGDRGSTVHQMTEDYDNGKELSLLNADGFPAYQLDEWKMVERYIEFTQDVNPNHELIEQRIVSDQLGCAGTIDRVTTINGKRYILDVKTSAAIYNNYWLQLAAYRQMFETETGGNIDGVAILWLNAKTRTKKPNQGEGWQLLTKEDTAKEWALFLAVQKLWLEEHEGEQPKQYTYQLKHKKKGIALAEYKENDRLILITGE